MYWQELKETLFCFFLSACQSNPLRWKVVEFIWFQEMIYSLWFFFFLSLTIFIFPLDCISLHAVACTFSVYAEKCTFGVVGPVKHEINQCHIFHALLPAHTEPKLNFTVNNLSSWHGPQTPSTRLWWLQGVHLCHQGPWQLCHHFCFGGKI